MSGKKACLMEDESIVLTFCFTLFLLVYQAVRVYISASGPLLPHTETAILLSVPILRDRWFYFKLGPFLAFTCAVCCAKKASFVVFSWNTESIFRYMVFIRRPQQLQTPRSQFIHLLLMFLSCSELNLRTSCFQIQYEKVQVNFLYFPARAPSCNSI